MLLEDYFDFQMPGDIRVKGTRIGIETILYDFIHRARGEMCLAFLFLMENSVLETISMS